MIHTQFLPVSAPTAAFNLLQSVFHVASNSNWFLWEIGTCSPPTIIRDLHLKGTQNASFLWVVCCSDFTYAYLLVQNNFDQFLSTRAYRAISLLQGGYVWWAWQVRHDNNSLEAKIAHLLHFRSTDGDKVMYLCLIFLSSTLSSLFFLILSSRLLSVHCFPRLFPVIVVYIPAETSKSPNLL